MLASLIWWAIVLSLWGGFMLFVILEAVFGMVDGRQPFLLRDYLVFALTGITKTRVEQINSKLVFSWKVFLLFIFFQFFFLIFTLFLVLLSFLSIPWSLTTFFLNCFPINIQFSFIFFSVLFNGLLHRCLELCSNQREFQKKSNRNRWTWYGIGDTSREQRSDATV